MHLLSLAPALPLAASAPPPPRMCMILALFAIASMVSLPGCRAIKGIFEAGFAVGAFIVVAFLVVVGGIVAMTRK